MSKFNCNQQFHRRVENNIGDNREACMDGLRIIFIIYSRI